jgi:hypothetical protein
VTGHQSEPAPAPGSRFALGSLFGRRVSAEG